MAYAHYWSRVIEFDRDAFSMAVEDIRLVIARAHDMGIRLAGPTGTGKPLLTPGTVSFNGSAHCRHRYRDLGRPFASHTASGVEEKEPPYDPKVEPYMSGPYLETRVCGGTCAAEPFIMDRVYMVRDWERPELPGRYACSCQTDFKPYDLITTIVLICVKERVGDAITISSENPEHGFEDALRMFREMFGFPSRFEIDKPEAALLL